jgi:hypothetical protein
MCPGFQNRVGWLVGMSHERFSLLIKFYLRPERPNLSVEDKTGVYSLTTPSGEEHQFAGIVDVARWATATACWMKRFGNLSR